jgi:fumarylacetoacetase
MSRLDETHDPARTSWVESANGHPDFPIQNLPLGVFSTGGLRRGGIAIGDAILDLAALAESDLLEGEAQNAALAASSRSLNDLLKGGETPRRALRRQVSALLSDTTLRWPVQHMLHDARDCRMHLPAQIGDYTDFYVGIHHAMNVGRLFRPDNPLLPNYKHVPIGYHGRASSVRPTGEAVIRPKGQIKGAEDAAPAFAPTRRLDYELELGVWISGDGPLGKTVTLAEADQRVAGLSLLNDWSARDIQAWEYQPLGPFLAKNFLTTVSPWIITAEALEPFRIAPKPRPAEDPALLPYLVDASDQARGGFALDLEVRLTSLKMRQTGLPEMILSRSHARHMYWTIGQMISHHSSNGCNLRAGDLLGTGTISAPTPDGVGSLLELTRGGAEPVLLPNGETRAFLEDGDEVTLVGRLSAPGFISLGFGACRGEIFANEAA